MFRVYSFLVKLSRVFNKCYAENMNKIGGQMYKIYISAECNWVNNNRSEIMINTNLNLFNLSREKCGRTTLYVLSVD